MRIAVFALLAGIAFPAFAGGGSAPPGIFGLYGERVPVCLVEPLSKSGMRCIGETANWVLVSPVPGHKIEVNVNLTFFNAHVCEFRGVGEWVRDHVFIKDESYGEAPCEMKLYFKARKVRLSDNYSCKPYTCGVRGGYEGVTLPRRGRL